MEKDRARATAKWSVWRDFPNPEQHGVLTAPFGPGCYELRRSDTGKKVIFGSSNHVALRMTSLLSAPLGSGTRRNSEKRDWVLKYLDHIEYRTIACRDEDEAKKLERDLKVQQDSYQFRT